jgi:hypothetical protein
MAIVSGVVCILAGVLKLGFITELLSKPIRYGYMNGIALMVLISQLPKLLGFSVEADGPLRSLLEIGTAIWAGKINWTSLGIGVGVLAHPAVEGSKLLPGVLIAVIGATVVAGIFDMSAKGVAVLGPLPEGLPAFSVPWIGIADLGPVLIGGAALALVSFADTSVLSRAYAARLGRPVNPNQEMVGLGRQPRRRPVSGLPHQQRSSRTPVAKRPAPDAGYRRGRRAGRGRVAGRRTRSPEASADARPGCGGHRFGDRLLRSPTCGASGVSSAGSSGCPSCAWSAWRCWAPFRASGWPW